MSELLDAALFLANKGWYVFPCHEQSLPPRLNPKTGKWIETKEKSPRTTNGVKDASNDPEQIKKWWSNGWSNSAIGVNCGKSHIFALDIDLHDGVNGVDNFHRLAISDEGCLHQFTPNKGFHVIFSDPENKGKPKTNKKLGIDCRGAESYIIVSPSFLIDSNGNYRHYVSLDDWNITPTEVSDSLLEKFGIIKKDHPVRGKYVSNETLSEKVQKAKRLLYKLPEDFADNRDDWVQVAMSLRELGDSGFELFSQWTEETYFKKKPESKRVGDLERVWKNLPTDRDDKISLASLYFWTKNKKEDNPFE